MWLNNAAKSGLFGIHGLVRASPSDTEFLLLLLYFVFSHTHGPPRPSKPPFSASCHYSPPRRVDVPGTCGGRGGGFERRGPAARPFTSGQGPPRSRTHLPKPRAPPPRPGLRQRAAAAAAAYQLSAGAGPAGSAEDRSAGGRGRARDRPPRDSGRRARAHTHSHIGPAPEGTSAAPGSARSRRARGLPLAAWSAALGAHPPWRWGACLREDGVLDDLPSRGVSAAHGAPVAHARPGGGVGEPRGQSGKGRPGPRRVWAGPASACPGLGGLGLLTLVHVAARLPAADEGPAAAAGSRAAAAGSRAARRPCSRGAG